MEKHPVEDIGLFEEILPGIEMFESRTWFKESLGQLGMIFADKANNGEEYIEWEKLGEAPLSKKLLNKIRGQSDKSSIKGKWILTYGGYREHNRSAIYHLYVLDTGELAAEKETTIISGVDKDKTTFEWQDLLTVDSGTNFESAEDTLNTIISNMNRYLLNPIPKIEG